MFLLRNKKDYQHFSDKKGALSVAMLTSIEIGLNSVFCKLKLHEQDIIGDLV